MEKIPFSRSEIDEGKEIMLMGVIPVQTFVTPIPPRENFRRAICKEGPLWMPNSNDNKFFLPRCSPDNTCRYLPCEIAPMDCPPEEADLDMFGIHWKFIPDANGPIEDPDYPFMLNDISEWKEKLVMPNPDEWNWAKNGEINRPYVQDGNWTAAWMLCGFFERLISLLGFMEAAMEIIDEDYKPDIHAFFDELTGVYEKIIDNMAKYNDIDSIYFHDDWGSQRASYLNPETVHEMIVPYLKRVVERTHRNGLKFELHSCGCNDVNIPNMIEAGVDIWAPQETANNIPKYWEEYGDKIMFGVYTHFDPEGSNEDCYAYAKAFVEKYVPYMKEKPVYLADTPIFQRLHPKMAEYIYEWSRRLLNAS